MATALEYWTELLDILDADGPIDSDPLYYTTGQAQEGEWGNTIRVLFERTEPGSGERSRAVELLDSLNFWLDSDNRDYWVNFAGDANHPDTVNLMNAAEQRLPFRRTDEQIAGIDTATGEIAPSLVDGGAGGGTTDASPQTLPGVLAGGQTIRVDSDQGPRWYQVYEFPTGSGQFMSFQFNDQAMVENTFGELPPFEVRPQTWFNQNITVEADAEEIIGLEGSFTGLTDQLMVEAAKKAGIRDPGIIGQIASDPEMQAIMVQALKGEWTPEQILAAQRNSSFWNDTLYPGIANFYGRTASPEKAWSDYNSSITPVLRQLGYVPDADGTFNSNIRKMLDLDIDEQTFLAQAPVFIQAQQNAEFATVLNRWAERDLGRSIDFNDWFGLVAGESIPDLESVAERAQLAHLAQNQGTTLDDAAIEELAARSQLSPAEAQRAFSEFNQAVLALGDIGLARGDLTEIDVLRAAAGIAPDSGSIDEVRRKVAKLAKEQDLFDEEKISFYVGFDPLGRPTRPGLQSLAPESA